jgi:hypothetical protein
VTLTSVNAGAPVAVKNASHLISGASVARSARVILWYRFSGSRRFTRSSETFASAVSISITVFADADAASGLSPSSSSIFCTCATYLVRISCERASSLK